MAQPPSHFVPMDVNFDSEPKIIEAGPVVELVFQRCLRLAKRTQSDGLIHHAQAQVLLADLTDLIGDDPAPFAVMVDVELLTACDAGYFIVSWPKYNPSRLDLLHKKSKGNHKRWHVDRGIVDPECTLCRGDIPPISPGIPTDHPTDSPTTSRTGTGTGTGTGTSAPGGRGGDGVKTETSKDRHGGTSPSALNTEDPDTFTQVKNALAEACYPGRDRTTTKGGDDVPQLTRQEWSRINKAAKDILDLGGTPEEVPVRSDRMVSAWGRDKVTPTSLSAHWLRFAAPDPKHDPELGGFEAVPDDPDLGGLERV